MFVLRAASADGVQRGERRRDDDLDVGDVLHERPRTPWRTTTASCTVLNIFQLPAMNGVRIMASGLTPALLVASSAATPGSVRPPRNSSDAPPPVEMCVMRSATPAFLTAAIESPPPMIVVPLHAGDRARDARWCRSRTRRSRRRPSGRSRPPSSRRAMQRRVGRDRSPGRCRRPSDRRSPGRRPPALRARASGVELRRRRRDRPAARACTPRALASRFDRRAPRRACRPRRATCRPAAPRA